MRSLLFNIRGFISIWIRGNYFVWPNRAPFFVRWPIRLIIALLIIVIGLFIGNYFGHRAIIIPLCCLVTYAWILFTNMPDILNDVLRWITNTVGAIVLAVPVFFVLFRDVTIDSLSSSISLLLIFGIMLFILDLLFPLFKYRWDKKFCSHWFCEKCGRCLFTEISWLYGREQAVGYAEVPKCPKCGYMETKIELVEI